MTEFRSVSDSMNRLLSGHRKSPRDDGHEGLGLVDGDGEGGSERA